MTSEEKFIRKNSEITGRLIYGHKFLVFCSIPVAYSDVECFGHKLNGNYKQVTGTFPVDGAEIHFLGWVNDNEIKIHFFAQDNMKIREMFTTSKMTFAAEKNSAGDNKTTTS